MLLVIALSVSSVTHASSTSKVVTVVTTIAPIANIIQNVGSNYVNVIAIVPSGTDSHTFEPTPSIAKLLGVADIIMVNGLDLELPTVKLAEKVKKPGTPIVMLGNKTLDRKDWQYDFSFPRQHGHPNPHLWPNIALSIRYAEIIRDSLIALDPVNKAGYIANTEVYLANLDELDNAIFDCIKSIPEKNRKLVTYHDSFAYFAPRYGLKIVAAVQPSNFSEPRPREVIKIIKQIKKENVAAIFGSEVFPSKVMRYIALETGVKFIDQLSDDELPPPPNNSFIGMMANNLTVMTDALGGDSGCMKNVNSNALVH
jgi:zinc/manganese transport system substrate-binding protein/manganese/iron transport system substrate-binding protein